jgi:predicted outer membrane protein
MKCSRICVVTATSAFVLAFTGVRAESDSEYGNRAPANLSSPWSAGQRAPQQASPAPRAAPRPAFFAPAAAAKAKPMSAPQRDERQFLKDAAASSRFEAEASRLALGKSHDAGVRSVAATLINHHAAVGNELLHMLNARGMAAPMLANDQRKILNRLAKLHGAKFDREFLQEVALRYQQEDIEKYEKASLVANDARLKTWIDRKLPTLRYHLATAERIAPADAKLARAPAQVAPATLANRSDVRASVATRSMGAAPASDRGKPPGTPQAGGMQTGGMMFGGMQFGDMQFGGDAQLGVTRSIAARPTESSNR